ncbi:PIG-L family deacetylase [Flavobacteriaceae bacterium F08102]|nr:PIG-L family deacetylase [Flavobacteriaceae bacterium F08102]
MKHLLIGLCIVLLAPRGYAQQPDKPNVAEIYEAIQKLNFLGSVLYVAAHPDDENTQMISYFSNKVHARTAYLSITRGDGGQNLIGPQLREQLGVIRTEELLAARRIDGGEQFFTRANDFGYSKHPDETLALWEKDEVLKDVVSIMRKFKPDVIINRFDHRTPGTTHGHHTSSAMLSVDAFDKLNDPSFKAHGLYDTWEAKRLFFNTSPWFYGSQEKFDAADKSNLFSIDVGVYYPLLGKSNNEIAALSRSQHQSQGFGSTGSRGTRMDYVEFLKGSIPKDKTNIFDGIDTSWNRLEDGAGIGKILKRVEQNFDFTNPAASIPDLVKAYSLVQKLQDEHWKEIKIKELQGVISACAGLYLEAAATAQIAARGTTVKVNLEAINRSDYAIKLREIKAATLQPIRLDHRLQNNVIFEHQVDLTIPMSEAYTSPYWLHSTGSIGMYKVANPTYIGMPETPKKMTVQFVIDLDGVPIHFERPIVYKFNDPVKGEVYQPFEVVPAYTSAVKEDVTIFSDNTAKEMAVTVRSSVNNGHGKVVLQVPNSWEVEPTEISFSGLDKETERVVYFKVTPPAFQNSGEVKPVVFSDGKKFTEKRIDIDYDHIPKQTMIVPSKADVVRLDIEKRGQRIGYIQGAGDQVPTSLRQIGYTVIELKRDEITGANLQDFDAVVLGIRVYNVDETAQSYQPILHEYVKNGGTLIVQYNTNRGLKVKEVAPLPLTLSRDRVVEEDAEVEFLNPKHELLNRPNIIEKADFTGWVQERGLYFPNKWSDDYTPILGMHDHGEKQTKGSLLVATYGKGYFIYTGISFFRELPAGVPGAYKLFANMLSIGKSPSDNLKN